MRAQMTRALQQPRVWIILPLAGLLLVVGGASFVRRVGAIQPLVGVQWVQSSEGPLAIRVDEGGVADRAGLRPGDLLLEVDGQLIASALDAGAYPWRAGVGDMVPLRVRRGADELGLHMRADWEPRKEPYPYLAIVGLAFWASGLFIALRWPDIRGGKVYAMLAACLFLNLVLSPTGQADRLDWAISWIELIAGALVPALLLHIGVALSRRVLPVRRTALALAYAVSGLLAASALWLTLGGAYRFEEPRLAFEVRDRIEILLLGLSLVLTTTLLVRSSSRSSSAMHRSQMRWLLWGLGVGLGPFVLLYAVPWALGAADLPTWAQFLAVAPMLLVPAAFTAALARYRLHDLDLLLVRSLTEVAAVFCTFGVLAAAIFLLREGLGGWFHLSNSATRYFGFLVAAVAYPQLRSWVRVAVEKAFYRKRYSYRATLLDWARELNAETDLHSLLGRLRERIRETLDVRRAEVLLRTGARRFGTLGPEAGGLELDLELDEALFERLRREAHVLVEDGHFAVAPWTRCLFPVRVKGRLRAVLAVAERESPNEPLTSEDRALLGTLAAHAGTAIEAARLVQQVSQRAEEIERLHARQARILESSAVGLLLLDREGRILDWNRALEGIYGLPRDQAIGVTLRDVFPLHVVRRIEREEGRAPGIDPSRTFRLSMVNRNDQRLVVNIATSPVEDGGRVVTFDDVTGQVKLEEQLLQQERLASLGLLAAGVAHEINTPLTGISGYAQLMLEECDEHDPRRAVLQKIEAQTRRASGIANSLLNMARPERPAFEALSINETVTEVLQLFEPQIRGRAIRMQVRLAPDLPAIRGNKGKLQQVLLNLLLNARDAVSTGGRVSVATSPSDGCVVVEVVDDGAGIAEEDLPRIFDPFFTTKGRGKGTGLGLSICYGIVQEHEGQIHVESSPGEATRFRLELPLARSAAATA